MNNVSLALCVCLLSVAFTVLAMLLLVRRFYDLKGLPVLFTELYKPGDEVVVVSSHMHSKFVHLVTLDSIGRKRVVYFINMPTRDDTNTFDEYKPGRYSFDAVCTEYLGTGKTVTTQSLEWLGVYVPDCQKPKLRMAG